MELTGILFLVVVLVIFILFIVAAVKSFAGWGVWYTVVLVFLFLSSLGFLYAAAGVADRRIRWVRIHDQLREQLGELREQAELLKFGDINQTKPSLDNLLGLANELSRNTLERGRVWRNANLTDFKPDSVKLSLAPKPPAAEVPADVPAPPAAEVNGDLPVEALVYAFGEAEVGGKVVPKVYLGEYFVAESQGGTATLRPVAALLPGQLQAIKSGLASNWTVFELMPLDSHDAYAEPLSERNADELFGRMDPQVLSDLFQIPLDLLDRDPSQLTPEESLKYRLLRAYVLDGSRAPENEAQENVWLRVEFLAEHTVDVDDTKSERKATDGGYFDFSGRAVDSRLKRKDGKGEVVFAKGQQAVIAAKPAKALIDQNIAKLIDPIFVRPIHDYTLGFKEKREQISQAEQDVAMVTRAIDQTKATNARLQEQVVFRQAERQLLDKDKGQYDKELAVINQEANRVAQAVQDMKTELSRLYRVSQQHYERLVRTQQALSQLAVP
jgi:hypothetical protein